MAHTTLKRRFDLNIFDQICAEADRLKAMTPKQREADAVRFKAELHIALATLRRHSAPVAHTDEIDQAEISLSHELADADQKRRLGLS